MFADIVISNRLIAMSLGSVVFVVGVVFAILAARWRGKALIAAVLIGIGGLFVAGGSGIEPAPLPVPPIPPGPLPPGPLPPPPGPNPTTTFQREVIQSFSGTREEALDLAGQLAAYAAVIGFDGQRQPPRVETVKEFGEAWQESQRYYKQSENPHGDRFDALGRVIAGEMKRLGVTGSDGPLTPEKRSSAILVLAEASEALEQVP